MVCPIGLPCCRSEFGPRITFVSSGPGGLLSCASLSKWALWSITRIPCASPTLGQPQRSDFSRPLCARIARCGFSERSFLPRKCWREDRVNRVRGGRAVEFTTQFDAHAVSGRRRFFCFYFEHSRLRRVSGLVEPGIGAGIFFVPVLVFRVRLSVPLIRFFCA